MNITITSRAMTVNHADRMSDILELAKIQYIKCQGLSYDDDELKWQAMDDNHEKIVYCQISINEGYKYEWSK